MAHSRAAVQPPRQNAAPAPQAQTHSPAQQTDDGPGSEFAKLLQKKGGFTEYKPLGEEEAIPLTIDMVRRYIAKPTKKGFLPEDADLIQFIMVCKQRRLNPWANDCWLLGYDTDDGPKFSIIVAVQALFKRAELSKHFNGIESGVIVERNGEVLDLVGDFILDGDKLLGGWANVYRKEIERPFMQRLKLTVYQRATGQWRKDPCGLICKCAEAGALRQAFPSDIGGLYLSMEMASTVTPSQEPQQPAKPSAKAAIAERLSAPPKEIVVAKAPPTEPHDPAPPESSQETEAEAGDEDQSLGDDEESLPAGE